MTTTELRSAAKKTTQIIKSIPEKEWPEDDWICLSENWDLNIWEGEGIKCATLYEVVDGQTQINKCWRIYTSTSKNDHNVKPATPIVCGRNSRIL